MTMSILYEKVGRRYKRVNDPWAYTGLREGHWHVWVKPNSVSVRGFVLPAKREVSAAIEEAREAMVKAMQEANKAKPSKTPLTRKEKKAIKAYYDVMGEDSLLTFVGLSIYDIVDAGIKVLAGKCDA